MSVVEFSSEENVAILSETFSESLADLGDSSRKLAVLKRLHELLSSNTPQHYVYESVTGCDELEVIRAGSDLRIFCRLVMGVPESNAAYNVLFVFDVVPHEYDPGRLATLDDATERRLRELDAISSLDSADEYLAEMDAFSASDVTRLIDRLDS